MLEDRLLSPRPPEHHCGCVCTRPMGASSGSHHYPEGRRGLRPGGGKPPLLDGPAAAGALQPPCPSAHRCFNRLFTLSSLCAPGWVCRACLGSRRRSVARRGAVHRAVRRGARRDAAQRSAPVRRGTAQRRVRCSVALAAKEVRGRREACVWRRARPGGWSTSNGRIVNAQRRGGERGGEAAMCVRRCRVR